MSPIVVSVPKWNRCLSLSDTCVNLDAVGLFVVWKLLVVLEALIVLAFEAPAFQVKVSPSLIVATNTSPKLSRLQFPGSKITELVVLAVPHVDVLQVDVPHP